MPGASRPGLGAGDVIPAPSGLTLPEWAAAIAPGLDAYDVTPALYGDDWQEWATRVTAMQTVRDQLPPDPYAFTEWSVWAERFLEATSALT